MANRRPIPTVMPSQERLTQSLRGGIETEAQNLLKAVRSVRSSPRRTGEPSRAYLLLLRTRPPPDPPLSGSVSLGLIPSGSGFGGAIRGFGGLGTATCLDHCEREGKKCTDSKHECLIREVTCIHSCPLSA